MSEREKRGHEAMTLKLKRTPGLYLVGFMASGKTTIGRSLADELGWNFIDIDSDIEAQEGKSISQIFIDHGEEGFRSIETAIIRSRVAQIEAGNPCVVALGGGAFVQLQNQELIASNGVSLWLDCPIERIRSRIGGDATRPLAQNQNGLGQLFEIRLPFYARADFRIDADTDDISQVVKKIRRLPIF